MSDGRRDYLAPVTYPGFTPELRTDFEAIEDGEEITLHPNSENPLHKKPVKATHQSGYFYCAGSDPTQGPDYYLGDVLAYNSGFTK